jgi:phosphatidate cytidylyltransferase
MSPLASRILVAVVGLPVVLALVYAGGWWLFTLAAVGGVFAVHEYSLMTRSVRPVTLAAYAGVLLTLFGAELGGVVWMVGGFMTTLLLAFVLHWVGQTRQSATIAISATVLGAAWIGFGLAYLLLLRAAPNHGRLATFAVLLAVWAGDIGAFFAGRLIGRHKLAPALSPGKTWEGFVFGTICTVFAAFVTLYDDRHNYLSIGQAVLLGLVVAVAGPLGDLFESGVKRDMQVKDSGRVLAGHGGVLDRLDAPLFAFVAVYYLLLGLGKL